MTIVITGSGAMGCRFGAALTDAGAEVWLHDVWARHIDAIHDRGLLIYDGLGGQRILRVNALTDISKAPSADALMIFTKAIHTRDAVKAARPVIGTNTVVITLQNGLGNMEDIEMEAPDCSIIAGVTNYASDLTHPGEVELKGSGITRLMALSESGAPMAEKLIQMLKAVGHNAEMSDDILVDIWEKVAFNAALNTVTAVTGLTVGAVGSNTESRALLFNIVSEVVAVARMEGVAARESHVRKVIESVFDPRMSGDHKTSMLQDRMARRPTEIGALCGQVIEFARRHGVKVPYNQTMYALVSAIERNYGTLCY